MCNLKQLFIFLWVLGLIGCICACGNSDGKDASISEYGKSIYQVTVEDELGNPLPDVMLQACSDTCFPGKTDENGILQFHLEKGEYKVSLMKMPDGYDYATEEQEWYFTTGENTITIVLKRM